MGQDTEDPAVSKTDMSLSLMKLTGWGRREHFLNVVESPVGQSLVN